MPRIHETAYPRLKSAVTEAELQEIYAPTAEEIAFAEAHTRSETARVSLLVLLKTFQRLGYFVTLAAVFGACVLCFLSMVCHGYHSLDQGCFVTMRANSEGLTT